MARVAAGCRSKLQAAEARSTAESFHPRFLKSRRTIQIANASLMHNQIDEINQEKRSVHGEGINHKEQVKECPTCSRQTRGGSPVGFLLYPYPHFLILRTRHG